MCGILVFPSKIISWEFLIFSDLLFTQREMVAEMVIQALVPEMRAQALGAIRVLVPAMVREMRVQVLGGTQALVRALIQERVLAETQVRDQEEMLKQAPGLM